MKKFLLTALAAATVIIAATPASARGACDGFQRCRCGTTAARHFGLPYAYKGFNLKQAIEWIHAFPRTSFHIGAAGVKPHHVLAIVGGSSCASATIYDDAGTRQRNVCGMVFVDPNGNDVQRASHEVSTQTYHAARRHRTQHGTEVAFSPPDRAKGTW